MRKQVRAPRRDREDKAGRRVRGIESLSGNDLLCWSAAWRPPVAAVERSQSRWATWGELFADYEEMREAFLKHPWAGHEPFAEQEYQKWCAAGRPTEWRGAFECGECGAGLYSCEHVDPLEDDPSPLRA